MGYSPWGHKELDTTERFNITYKRIKSTNQKASTGWADENMCMFALPLDAESFSFSISPSNEYSGLISFRIDWFDLLAVQQTLKSLLQHHNWKASVLQCSAFFMI